MCSGDVCMAESSLPSFVEVVPAGITAIIKMQAAGYAYVKP
jgi:intracellular sulfur oxidation DsrE/DsrF family protein